MVGFPARDFGFLDFSVGSGRESNPSSDIPDWERGISIFLNNVENSEIDEENTFWFV